MVAAEAAKIVAAYLSIVPGTVTDEDAVAFSKDLTEPPGPKPAEFRTGTHSAAPWPLSQAKTLSVVKILNGYRVMKCDRLVVSRGLKRYWYKVGDLVDTLCKIWRPFE